ncbi:FAD/NAD(P)-binding domain-containing protein [Ganoderma leucocontextum]|nr:FAD/NAD(P)-binding domain-containing protein [Ganoderma leucocontextum]
MPVALNNPVKLRVAIVGAGLGGLIFALLMQKHAQDSMEVDIYESAHELTEVGAGVSMWPRIWKIVRYLGLEDELLEISGAGRLGALPMVFTKSDEPTAVDVTTLPPGLYPFHRANLQKLFAKHLRAYDRIRYAKRLASFAEPASDREPVVLKFEDGTEATCDVLVGCDGIKSAVRRTMYTDLAKEAEGRGEAAEAARLKALNDPVWSGTVAYRDLVPAKELEESVLKVARVPHIVMGKNKNVVFYPISGGEIINVVAFVDTPGARGTRYDGPWVTTATTEEVTQQFAGWDMVTHTLIKSMVKPTLWSVHTVGHLPTYVKGRAVLLGDAAHAMTPHQGSGAGQAIEDGLVLSSLLAHHSVTLETLPRALKIYDIIRRPFSQNVQRGSDEAGSIYHLNELGWDKVSAEESAAGSYSQDMIDVLGRALEEKLDWVMEGDFMETRVKAMSMLETVSV